MVSLKIYYKFLFYPLKEINDFLVKNVSVGTVN
jgi:hypothetical protein